jgi:hypothetical protein
MNTGGPHKPAWQRYGLTETAAQRLDSFIVAIARALRPEASSRDASDGMRIGRKGSLLIRPSGAWSDFESDVHGRGALELVAHLIDADGHDLNPAATTQFAQRWLSEHPGEGKFKAAAFDVAQAQEQDRGNAAFTQQVLRDCGDAIGNEGERYLRGRSLLPPYPDCVRLYPNARLGEAALVGTLSMPDGRVVGVQLGYIDPSGRKSTGEPARRIFFSELDPEKRRGAAFRITASSVSAELDVALGPAEADPDDDEPQRLARNARKLKDAILIAEGLEDAQSLSLAFPFSTIVGLPGIGALRHQQVKAHQIVIVVKDGDAEDAGANRALQRGVDELLLQQAKVEVTATPTKANGAEKIDANLILQRDGIEALQELVLKAVPARLSLRGALRKLASLPKDEREQLGKAVAAAYAVRISYVRQEVAALRNSEADEDQRKLVSLVKREPQPWLGPVDLGEIFDELIDLLQRILVCTEPERLVVAAWIIHTYVFEQFTYTPRLCIISPEPRCGKTTLVNFLTLTCYRAASADGLTPALFVRIRSVTGTCTVLLDEMSETLHESHELDDVLRSGFERDKCVYKLRALPDGDFVPEAFEVFNPVAIAVLRTLQAALSDRCVMIRLQRKPKTVRLERLRKRALREQLTTLADKLMRWRSEHATDLSDDPLPDGSGRDPIEVLTSALEAADGINDRQIDFSIPLLAIGQAMGGDRESRLRDAILTVLGAEGDIPETVGPLLLQDLRPILDQYLAAREKKPAGQRVAKGKLAIGSAELVRRFLALPGSPWGGEDGMRPLTQYRLSRLLRPYGVIPRMIGPNDKRVSGYLWLHLSDACDRYLNSVSPESPDSGFTPSHFGGNPPVFDDFQDSHLIPGVSPENTPETRRNPPKCEGVNPESGNSSKNTASRPVEVPDTTPQHNPDGKNFSVQKSAELPPVAPPEAGNAADSSGPIASEASPSTSPEDTAKDRPTYWENPSE